MGIDKFDEMFQCSFCYESMDGLIMGCPDGHNVCSECHTRWAVCGLCRQQISVRNRQMECFREQLTVVCSCKQAVSTKDLPSHRAVCEMQPIRCPLACPTNALCFNLTRNGLEDHVQRYHPDIPFQSLDFRAIEGEVLSFNTGAPEWTLGMKVKVVPSDDASAPTIVSFSRPGRGIHSVVMMYQAAGMRDREEAVVKLKSYCSCVNGIVVSTSTSLGGEVRAIHRQFRCNDEICVHVSFDARHSSSIDLILVTTW